ncbi:unnamed protein product [Allacma fusca]|uniref:Uncharacterized protein n=1 Tax=Allacma fusca TaxID=39272 RepID=A0A8J2PBI3_9HEXA|nr:unnamed protein product [Allacma fusca]
MRLEEQSRRCTPGVVRILLGPVRPTPALRDVYLVDFCSKLIQPNTMHPVAPKKGIPEETEISRMVSSFSK